MKNKLLIAEDDPNFGMVLKSFLEVNDFSVTLCKDGNMALSALKMQEFDLCILDVMMPRKDGFLVADYLKKNKPGVPFVFLTAKAMKKDQIKGYALGAVDYLVKPFDPDILLLKVTAILDHYNPYSKRLSEQYEIGSFSFDCDKRQLSLGTVEQKLSPKESDLLQLLCANLGTLLTREEALVKIWKEDSYFTTKSMDVYITKLRKYLKADPQFDIRISNLHGKGFVLSVERKGA